MLSSYAHCYFEKFGSLSLTILVYKRDYIVSYFDLKKIRSRTQKKNNRTRADSYA